MIDGIVEVTAKARGMNGAFNKVKEIVLKDGVDFVKPYYAGYSGDPDILPPFVSYLKEALGREELPTNPIGATVGVHAGPGARGFGYFVK